MKGPLDFDVMERSLAGRRRRKKATTDDSLIVLYLIVFFCESIHTLAITVKG